MAVRAFALKKSSSTGRAYHAIGDRHKLLPISLYESVPRDSEAGIEA